MKVCQLLIWQPHCIVKTNPPSKMKPLLQRMKFRKVKLTFTLKLHRTADKLLRASWPRKRPRTETLIKFNILNPTGNFFNHRRLGI